jgi:hypothetical protein
MAIDIVAAIFVVSILGVVYLTALCLNMRHRRRFRSPGGPKRATLSNQLH